MTTRTVMLEQAIARWKDNAAATTLLDFKVGWQGCSFCQAYHNPASFLMSCDRKCPIYAATGKERCEGTPYHEAYEGFRNFDLPAAKAGAVKMVAFLEGLRGSVK